jgi:hypothetical protein
MGKGKQWIHDDSLKLIDAFEKVKAEKRGSITTPPKYKQVI